MIDYEALIANISKEFRKEENDIREEWSGDNMLPYRNGILEGIRLAEIIIKQQIRSIA